MSTVFDRWSELDTALLLRRIEAAHGSVVFDRYAYADPQHALKQIESAFSVTLNSAGALSFSAIAAAIDAAVDGGGDTPNWVPANAKIHIDLVNNRAWTEADGIVAINTLLGADANTTAGWGATSYDAGNLTADGYVTNGAPAAFIGSARTRIIDAATVRVMLEQPIDASLPAFVLVAADGNDAIEIQVEATNPARNLHASSWNGSLSENIDNILNTGVGAKNTLAFTITPSRLDIVANGATALTSALLDADRPAANPLVAALIEPSGHAIQSITIYDALPNTTGLSALSRVIPENAKIHINLVQQWAWTEADGIVAIDTLLGSDPNTVNAWSTSNYDPAQLTAYGYVAPDLTVLALIGGARERVLSGSTLVLRNIIPTSDLSVGLSFVLASATGNNTIEIDLSNNVTRDVFAYSGGGSANLTYAPIVNAGANGAINTLAATVTTTRLELSVNGSTALSTALTTDDFPVLGDVLVAALISQPNATNALQSITIYDALPDTTGLSALSQTGVTNTAPHDFTYTWDTTLLTPTGNTATCSAADIVTAGALGRAIFQMSAIDSEGNPLVGSLVSDSSGKFDVAFAGGGPVFPGLECTTGGDDILSAADSPVTLVYRFTDPGGLYVEQAFTITVTA